MGNMISPQISKDALYQRASDDLQKSKKEAVNESK